MSKNEDLNLSDEIKALSEQLTKKLAIAEDGTITPDKDLYKETLPEGLTMDAVKALQHHNANLVVATAHAVGILGADFLKKHKKVDEVHLEKLQIGRDHLRMNYKRTAPVSGIGGVQSTKHGWLTGKYVSASAGITGAAFGRVRAHHAELGAELFGK